MELVVVIESTVFSHQRSLLVTGLCSREFYTNGTLLNHHFCGLPEHLQVVDALESTLF